jgi:hypothetical protein
MPQGRERRRIAVEVAGQLEVTIFFRQWCARQSVCVVVRAAGALITLIKW